MTEPTSPPPSGEHLSADTLADLLEDLLDEAQTQAAQTHLQSCDDCSAERDRLAAVPALLAMAADAGPIPDDVGERLDQALAAAAAAHPPVLASPTVTPMTASAARVKGTWGMRLLQAAAVLVLLLGGTAVVLSALDVTLGGETTTSAGKGDASVQDAAPGAEDSASFVLSSSGRNWDADTVVAAAPDLIAGRIGPSSLTDGRATSERAQPETLATNPAQRLAGGPDLATCIGNLNLGPVTPLAVDVASWQGSPAAVIVLPTSDSPEEADLFVVTPECPRGEFLFFARVDRT